MKHNLQKDLMFTLHQVSGLIHEKQKTERGADLIRGQGRLLRSLDKEDGISQQELAERVSIQPASLSELIVKLEQKDHIVRKVNADDRRRYNIYITEEGRELAKQIREARTAVSMEVFSILEEEEQKELLALLEKLVAGMKTEKD